METEYVSIMNDRIKILQKSIKKSRKRKRSENEEGMCVCVMVCWLLDVGVVCVDGEDVCNKENLEARVKELDEELAAERANGT